MLVCEAIFEKFQSIDEKGNKFLRLKDDAQNVISWFVMCIHGDLKFTRDMLAMELERFLSICEPNDSEQVIQKTTYNS